MESATEKHLRYLNGAFTLESELPKYLQKIKSLSELNAWIDVYGEEAYRRAKEIDQKRARGEKLGPLAGLFLAVKDNIAVKDHPLTCGSHILNSFITPYNATVIERILAADGIILGKANMDEFAMGSSNENSYFGVVHHPVDAKRVPGGSSGGSVVCVATGMADLALGSETGGSVRQPSAFCGVVGLKPSYGRVSRYGLVAFASSLDQIGPIGRSVEDVALLLGVIAGEDAHDSTAAPEPVPDYLKAMKKSPKDLSIGIPKEFYGEGLDEEVRDRITGQIERLKSEGYSITEVSLPLTEYAIATYYIIATAEASSNLARYDGVRYGFRDEDASELREMYFRTRDEGFGREVKRRIMLGTYVLSAGYYDAYYKKAQQVRRLIRDQYEQVFKEVDLLLTPTTPTPAFLIGAKVDDPLQMYLSDIFTVTANLSGICGLNVPAGKTRNGLPIGLQLLADAFREDKLFRLGAALEKITAE